MQVPPPTPRTNPLVIKFIAEYYKEHTYPNPSPYKTRKISINGKKEDHQIHYYFGTFADFFSNFKEICTLFFVFLDFDF